ncbi:MAG: gamma-glutamyl-gamma-aminobutyrate hydrolase family protein [Ignavibacteria bacterium]|nr:gamma-glutamyl-gamma-aminobutyrate hydrolase family protein [Ignavibacteria bacterium]
MIKIGLSYYGSKIQNYIEWISVNYPSVEIANLSHDFSSANDLLKCSALLLPGGGDVHPNFYGHDNSHGLSKKIDEKRDAFESELFKHAIESKMPVLGICRGMQIVNVFLGGTLSQDIPNHRSKDNNSSSDLVHNINVEKKSLLFKLTNNKTGNVNSSHHQAVDKVASDLRITSTSSDGIIESLEWKDDSNKSPILLVQWHPERMIDREQNYFSKNILEWFINNLK